MPVIRRQRGFTLLEILIAIVIFSIGLLGIAGLQVAGMRFTHGSQLRTIAVAQAETMSDLMRANEYGVQQGYYDMTAAMPTAASPDCGTAAVVCNSQQRATYDLASWNTTIASAPMQANNDVLPNGKGYVCRDSTPNDGDSSNWACDHIGDTYAIKLEWTERSSGANDTGNATNTDQNIVTQHLVMTVVPGISIN